MHPSISALITAPWATAVVFTAVRLNIFTICSKDPMTTEEVASQCKARPKFLEPLLDVCCALGLLVVINRRYVNSHFSRVYLAEGGSLYVGDLIKLQYNESQQWGKLHEIVAGTDSSSEDSREAKQRTFIKAMHNLGLLGEAEALSRVVDLSACTQMVDAGGGSGIYSVVLCRKYPHLRSTILDKKETLAITTELLADHKEKARITLREADIEKDSFGEDFDVVLLSDVVYNVTAAESVLKNAWTGLQTHGQLILRGYYADPDHSNPLFGALFRVGELVFDPEKEALTLTVLEEVIRDSGFAIKSIAPLTERSFLVISEKEHA